MEAQEVSKQQEININSSRPRDKSNSPNVASSTQSVVSNGDAKNFVSAGRTSNAEIPYTSSDDEQRTLIEGFNSQPINAVHRDPAPSISPPLGFVDMTASDKDLKIVAQQQAIQVLQGKLKGFETLGVLYQHCKQESGKYKHENQLLRHQLSILQQQQQQQQLNSGENLNDEENLISILCGDKTAITQNLKSSEQTEKPATKTGIIGDNSTHNQNNATVNVEAGPGSKASQLSGSAKSTVSGSGSDTVLASDANSKFQNLTSARTVNDRNLINYNRGQTISIEENMKSYDSTTCSGNSCILVGKLPERSEYIVVQQSNLDKNNTGFENSSNDKGTKDPHETEQNFESKDPRETELVRPRYTTSGAGEEHSWDLPCALMEEEKGAGKAGLLSPEKSPSRSSSSFVRISTSESEMGTRETLDLETTNFADLGITKEREMVGRGLSESSNCSTASINASLTEDLKKVTIKAEKLEKDCKDKQKIIYDLREQNEELKRRLYKAQESSQSSNSSYSLIVGENPNIETSAAAVLTNAAAAAASTTTAAAADSHQAAGEIPVIAAGAPLSQAVTKLTDSRERLLASEQLTEYCQDLQKQTNSSAADTDAILLLLEQERNKSRYLEQEFHRIAERNKQLEVHLANVTQLDSIKPQLKEEEAAHCKESSADQRVSVLLHQIQLLKQQLKVFKEDFDYERRDREKAKSEADDYRRRVNELQKELLTVKHTLDRTEAELQETCNKNKKLESDCSKLSKNMQDFMRHNEEILRINGNSRTAIRPLQQMQRAEVRSEELTSSTTRSNPSQVNMLSSNHRHHRSSSSLSSLGADGWPCPCCTLVNDISRDKCLACFTDRPGSHQQLPYGAVVAPAQLQQQLAQQQYQAELIPRSDNSRRVERSSSDISIG